MGQEEQPVRDEKRVAWDRYLDAWAGTIVKTIDGYGKGFQGTAFEVSRKDVLRTAQDLIRRELADAWEHRPGDGASPEVVAFLAEHDETAALRREVAALKEQRDSLEVKLGWTQAERDAAQGQAQTAEAREKETDAACRDAIGKVAKLRDQYFNDAQKWKAAFESLVETITGRQSQATGGRNITINVNPAKIGDELVDRIVRGFEDYMRRWVERLGGDHG